MTTADRAKRMGSIERVGGQLYVRLSRRADPTRKRIAIEEPLDDEEAKQLAHEMSLEMLRRNLTFAPAVSAAPSGETVAEWSVRWVADRVARQLVEDERHDQGRLDTHILPVIGTEPMASIGPEPLERLVLKLDEEVRTGRIAWKTASNVWGIVTRMFRDARRSKNPALRVRPDDPTRDIEPPERGEQPSKAWLYPSEFSQLITSPVLTRGEGLPRHLAANVVAASLRWRRLFALAIYLYPREGELRTLRWSDIDLDRWIVRVQRAAKRDTGGKVEKSTKTGRVRLFPIEPALRPLLWAMAHEPRLPSGRVIALPHEADLAERLRRYLQWAGVERAELFAENDPMHPPINFRDLRATGITWRAIRGDDALKIQRAAGHSSLSTTQGYIRIAEDMGALVGTPFPPLPEDLLGPCPKPVPNPSHESTQPMDIVRQVCVPSGIRNPEGGTSGEDFEAFGTNRPTTSAETAPNGVEIGTPGEAVESSLRRSLGAAVAAERWGEVAELARELERRQAARNDPKVAPLRGRRGA